MQLFQAMFMTLAWADAMCATYIMVFNIMTG